MDAVTQLATAVGVVAACDFLSVARASFYRQRPILGPAAVPPAEPAPPAERAVLTRALSPEERSSVRAVLHEERFQDRSPAAVQAKVNSADKLYLVIESVRPDTKHSGASNAPVPVDGA